MMDAREVATLWSRYKKAAEKYQAKLQNTGDPEAMRKAIVFRANQTRCEQWLAQHALVKAYPLHKKFKWKGLDVSIENAAGSTRHWKDHNKGTDGYTYMSCDYGYLRNTGGVDGDHVDAYFGPDPEGARMVYVVRQLKSPDFRYYDEDKCMIGFESKKEAEQAYLLHYTDPRFLGGIDSFPVDAFLYAVKQTKKAPAPVGGWMNLRVQQELQDLLGTTALPKDAVVFDIEKRNIEEERKPHHSYEMAVLAAQTAGQEASFDNMLAREALPSPTPWGS